MEQYFCYKDKNEWQIVMADILVITTNLEHCSSLCNGQFSIKRSKSFYKKNIYALVQSYRSRFTIFFMHGKTFLTVALLTRSGFFD